MSSIEANGQIDDPNRLRSISAQFLATAIVCLLWIDGAFIVTMPVIMIPALSSNPKDHNPPNADEYLTMTDVQASWLASLAGLLKPLSSIASGFISDKLGRKLSMILVNIPFFVGWLMLYQATSLWQIFTAFVILGVSVSLVVVPVMNYAGEIYEPRSRSILISATVFITGLASFLVMLLNTLIAWRTIALVFMFVPVAAFIALFFIPETPQWLLSKGRVDDAEKSLSWLRGWVSKDAVAREFNDMKRLNDKSNQETSNSTPGIWGIIAEFKSKRTYQPFIIMMAMYIITQCTGQVAMQPYQIKIFNAFDSPIPADSAAAALSFSHIVSAILFICIIRFTGKRHLYLTTFTIAFLSSVVIAGYGLIIFPPGYNSFDTTDHPSGLMNKSLAWIPFIALFLKNFVINLGVASVSDLYLCELFSFKARSMLCGVCTAVNALLVFLSTKTYYNFDVWLSLQGVSTLYAVLMGIGLVLMYLILPETEGCSLQDIELHFTDDSTKLTDRKIMKTVIRDEESEEKEILE